VQGGLERSITDLQNVAGNLFQALADGPAIHRLQCQDLQDKQVQGSLDQVRRFAHAASLGYRDKLNPTPLGKQEENEDEPKEALQNERNHFVENPAHGSIELI
jgi:hypothetical protein